MSLHGLEHQGSGDRSSTKRSGSFRQFLRTEHFGKYEGSKRRENDEDEDLKWAALEKLPTYDRLRATVVGKGSTNDRSRQVDLTAVGYSELREIIHKIFNLNLEDDNEKLLSKLRSRMQTVGIQQPTVEVRYENLDIDAKCHVGVRALPTLYNSAMNVIDTMLERIGLSVAKKTDLKILNDVSGILKPGRMTLLLGPPSSGKTTLLLALSAKQAPGLNVSGKVTFNGHRMDEFIPQKTCSYISQNDEHMGELTVRETLNFSARCQGVGSRYELLTELLKREKELGIRPEGDVDFFMKASALNDLAHEIITEYTMKILSLDVCADTFVGDEMRRGISGGQMKRVTIGEMIVGPVNTLFMDEISTGLDSSTTFQIIKCFSQIAHYMDSTMLISLLQPAPETFNLFDDIILLSEGQIVYHGPREHVLEFFEKCGFKCPERKGVGDFLQEVTSSKDQEQYWADKNKPYEYVSVKIFSDNYKEFHVGERMHKELAIPYDKSKSHKAALVFQSWALPKWDLSKITFDRELIITKRTATVHKARLFQICLAGFLGMSLFFRTRMHRRNFEDARVYNGALFYGLSTTMFSNYADIPATIARFPVFFKQRDLRFYPSWAFTIALAATRLPFSILGAFMYTCIAYYTIGFAPSPGRFFRQNLTLMLAHQMATSLFRMISGICRTRVVANCLGAFTLLVMFVEGGFVLPSSLIKPWWKWAHFLSPMMYAQQALSVNEFLAPQWDQPVQNGASTLGKAFLEYQGYYSTGFWFWLAAGVLLFDIFFMNFIFTLAVAYLSGPGRPTGVLSEEELAQKKSAQGQLSLEESYALKPLTTLKRSLPRSVFGSQSRGRKSFSQEEANMNDGSHICKQNSTTSETNSNKNSRSQSNSSLGLAARDSLDLQRMAYRKKGMVLPFQPLAIAFDDINYYVDLPAHQGLAGSRLQLLRDITGAFRPGVLSALVGVTGAGKSTLLDVLAGRKTKGYVEGNIYISGFPKNQKTFARIAGYCEQNDIHSPQLTVHESLLFSARLRLAADIDNHTKETFVLEVMDLIELTGVKDALVGYPGVTGLSTEQRKRLTIAVELVANPSIIFMDEPTSGLDARSAAIVMRTVRNTVDTGRTVVCTIHQPSIDIFESFDELLLLKRGGELVYAGPLGRQSHKLVKYFEGIPGVPKIIEGYNPATWMLEVASPNTEKRLGIDFAQIYQASPLYEQNKSLVKELSSPAPNAQDLSFPTPYSQSTRKQIYYCLWKQNITYYRSPQYNNVRIVFITFSALFFGTEYLLIGHKRGSQKDLLAVMGAVYASALFLGVQNASTVQPVVYGERAVFYRERAAGMFSSMPYALSQVLIEIPYLFIECVIYSLITYSMIGLQWKASKFLWYFYFMFFTLLYWTYFGMLGVALTSNQTLASIATGFWYNCWNILAGFTLPKPRIPIWWEWLYRACPMGWTVYGVIVSQFGDLTDVYTTLPDGSRITVAYYLEHYLGYRNNFLHTCAGMILVFPVFFAVAFLLAIKCFNFQKR